MTQSAMGTCWRQRGAWRYSKALTIRTQVAETKAGYQAPLKTICGVCARFLMTISWAPCCPVIHLVCKSLCLCRSWSPE